MLDRIIKFSIANKLIVILFTLGLVGWGTYSLTHLSIDAVPDITDNQVQVITTSPSLAAAEVEQLITFPVESSLATIPSVEQIRSVSSFGLSVVTVIFREKIDIYWARQQIQERLNEATEQIPVGVGKPEMAPVTTGLGEIYQYTLKVKSGFESRYDLTELRTIQDWVVRRQLLGTEGVADVSSFGGYLKQYEVSFDPQILKAVNVTLTELFETLESNNQNAGGAYIERDQHTYFIRTEGRVKNISDIENLVVKVTPSGIPVLVRDVANVKYGHAVRYGAMTRNESGETVGGLVLMLKGGNSNQIIKHVKEKVKQIEKTLPEGITVEPFLDRSGLVTRAIHTVVRNLTEGALIVIFVLVIFLGNLRSGLLVASVIPLSMLFAIGMMTVFNVTGNLMSLGAIDFGLIVDGAVIIVDSVVHEMMRNRTIPGSGMKISQQEMDKQVYHSTGKMMHSAAFGQIIILIVYLPVLTLTGIEGKMFRPMAETVSFAILGAMILSLTYLPVMATFILPKRTDAKENFSDRLLDLVKRGYRPVINFSLKWKQTVVGVAVVLFCLTALLFSRMGSEFIPQLDEGDFAVEMRLLPGSSLSETIKTAEQAAGVLLKKFPEVKEVVGKIGSSEIRTDPMPVEATDLIVILKKRSEWKSAHTRDELAEKMSESLEVLPGVTFGFQQPIQMRFNELMTGARQDVVLKIYGENLDSLAAYAQKTGDLIRNTRGINDLYVEQITGLPQIVVQYNFSEVAKYGLKVREVNEVVETAFAGRSAGLVYEGERRFDLVLRMDSSLRTSLRNLENLFIPVSDGGQIPLSEVARVEIREGPNQIQRDETRRRIIVGFNVRDRDVQSIVDEIQEKIDSRIKFSPGYNITYGGQFENLNHARQRLGVALPVAMLFIFILLFFAFRSIKESLLIFTAIPLAAIGGVVSLWIRDMPFSISAGVGFIALFGVAVLNGIVLINEFNRLKKDGVTDLHKRVLVGTDLRLRPVLMTATVASLGFLPMAISTTAGAEVQRPLATVVIGGLVTSTILTLVVLPALYVLFENFHLKRKKMNKTFLGLLPIIFGLVLFFSKPVTAQDTSTGNSVVRLSLEQAQLVAEQHNLAIRDADLNIGYHRVMQKASFDPEKTEITGSWGKLNEPVIVDNEFSIHQRIAFPTVYFRQSKLGKEQVKSSLLEREVVKNKLYHEVGEAWFHLTYLFQKKNMLNWEDRVYARFVEAARLRYETGETNKLEVARAESFAAGLQTKMMQIESDIEAARFTLNNLLNTGQLIEPDVDTMPIRKMNAWAGGDVEEATNPTAYFLQQQINAAQAKKSLQQSRMMPDIALQAASQTFKNQVGGRYGVFDIGLSIPLFPGAQIQKVKAAEMAIDRARNQHELYQQNHRAALLSARASVAKYNRSIDYFLKNALPQVDLILFAAAEGYRNGEVGYVEYIQSIDQVVEIKTAYLETVYNYNLAVIYLEFLVGPNHLSN